MILFDDRPVLVTGATGYVGGRLVPRLLEKGLKVRALGRSLDKLRCRPWAGHPGLELVRADALDARSMEQATQGCGAAFYLVHSMIAAQKDYPARDRTAAMNMVRASASANLSQLIYLGGLGEEGDGLSEHLKSRTEVGRILSSGPTPTTVLRAAMILGSGSASFELLRYLVERLPVMITPKWIRSRVQPISIRNVLGYLEGCLFCPETRGRVLDIGGPDILRYEELFRIYAEEAGLPPRVIIPVPFLTPTLSAYWIHLVTPVPASIARPLAGGLKNDVVVRNDRIRDLIPQELMSCRQTIRLALERVRQQTVETCWMDAGLLLPPEWPYCMDGDYTGGTVFQLGCRAVIEAEAEEIWPDLVRIGGRSGYYYAQGLWRLRGLLDRLAGGAGLARGRRDPDILNVGDAVDFWRVLKMEPGRKLVLMAEMKMPGQALLELVLSPKGGGRTELSLVARFLPRGLTGLGYWYVLLPAHRLVYRGMLEGLAARLGRPLVSGPEIFAPDGGYQCALPMSPKKTPGE